MAHTERTDSELNSLHFHGGLRIFFQQALNGHWEARTTMSTSGSGLSMGFLLGCRRI